MAGRYRLVESIGQGGMGRVWRASDDMLDRPVAVKEMRIDGLDQEDGRTRRERTLREARATARIDHPNVVRVYDVVDEGERLWIVMELVDGRSLEQIVAADGPLTVREAARLGLGLVAALREVHAGGVLHRDIKPGNVLVERRGHRIVLTDFGIAAMQDAKALTMAGMLVGSPDYMAPERVSGQLQGPPSDVWSLGATLCAALGGRSPFARSTTLATLHAVLYEEPELPSAAGELRDVLAALLEKEPSVRPGLTELEQALAPLAFPVRTPAPGPISARDPGLGSGAPAQTAPETGNASADASPEAVNAPAGGLSDAPTEVRPTPGTPAPRPGPPGELPDPALPSAARAGRRRTVLAGAAAVLAGAVTALVLTATNGPFGGHGDGALPRSSVPSVTADTGTASRTPTVEGTSRPPSLPPGARREAGGFAWATPEGWRRDLKTGAEVHYTSPDGAQELVARSALARGDLMRTWRTSERNAHQGQDYRKVRLERTTFRGRPAVVWEYTFTMKGVRWHARLLGFDADGKSYQINTWYQPGIENRALRTYEKVKDSFTVL